MSHRENYDGSGAARFITFVTYKRVPAFRSRKASEVLLSHIVDLRRVHQIKILAYVIMPEHVHLVLWPGEGTPLAKVIGQMKGRCAHEVLAILQEEGGIPPAFTVFEGGSREHRLWLPRVYDHHCRSTREVRQAIVYCHENPVNRGLCRSPSEWPFSSYRQYLGIEGEGIEIDLVEL